jgi:putative spermidine/putrescine transport system ATP-binding protein
VGPDRGPAGPAGEPGRRPVSLVRVDGLRKAFGPITALAGISFEVRPGEFVSLLGPSGCGKTTTLRIIAGLEHQDAGAVYLGAEEVSRVPAHRRDIGVVFQDYALFPHMTVFDNVAFGLRMRAVPAREIARRVGAQLELVRLVGCERRLPRELSGGQQQRVALSRALVIQPRVLLLDEPLSNLDARLRHDMRREIKQICTAAQATTILVTHDQAEALSLSDRIIIMDQGRIAQQGAPLEIYDQPATEALARFMGQPNIVRGEVLSTGGGVVRLGIEPRFETTATAPASGPLERGSKAVAMIKKERIRILPGEASGPPDSHMATLEFVNFVGADTEYHCAVEGVPLVVRLPRTDGQPILPVGTRVRLHWEPGAVCLLTGET